MTEIKKQKDIITRTLDTATWAAVISLVACIAPILLNHSELDRKLGFRVSNNIYNTALYGLATPISALFALPFAYLASFLHGLYDKSYTKYERSAKFQVFLEKIGFNDSSFGVPLEIACTKFYDEILITFYSATLIKDKFNSSFWFGDKLKSISDFNNSTSVRVIIEYINDKNSTKDEYLCKLVQTAQALLGENFGSFYNDLSSFCSKADIILPKNNTNNSSKVKFLL